MAIALAFCVASPIDKLHVLRIKLAFSQRARMTAVASPIVIWRADGHTVPPLAAA